MSGAESWGGGDEVLLEMVGSVDKVERVKGGRSLVIKEFTVLRRRVSEWQGAVVAREEVEARSGVEEMVDNMRGHEEVVEDSLVGSREGQDRLLEWAIDDSGLEVVWEVEAKARPWLSLGA